MPGRALARSAKSEQFEVRLSSEEKRALEKAAHVNGCTASQFVRSLVVTASSDNVTLKLQEAAQVCGDMNAAPEDRRAALLALTANAMFRALELREGYASGKAMKEYIDALHSVEGTPTEHVKITGESRSLNAHVHTTWEERVDAAHRAHPQPGSLIAAGNDASDSAPEVVDARVVRTKPRKAETVEAAGG